MNLIFNYQSSWKYSTGTTGFNSGFQAVNYDDTSWSTGLGMFGSSGVNTIIPTGAGREACFRKTFTCTAATLYWTAIVDDSITVYVDAVSIFNNIGALSASVTYYGGVTLAAGSHKIAVRLHDEGLGATFFDLMLEEDTGKGWWNPSD